MPLKHFRRYAYAEADVDRVIKHLKLHGRIGSNDIVTRPLKKPRRVGRDLVHNEPIPWVLPGLLKGSWQSASLKPGPSGKLRLYGSEDGVWKHIVPAEEVETYLRQQLLDPASRMPMGRDSAHHHLMKTTIGISRRAAYGFLEQQSVLQITKNIPDERKKGGKPLAKRGWCEMDLIEGQGRDIAPFLKNKFDRWYWLSVIDRLTGWGCVEMVQDAKGAASKQARWVADALKEALKRLEHALGTKVHTISADHGREFFDHVRKFLVRRGTKLKQVSRGSRVEQFNKVFQNNFYRLARLQRGSFSQLEQQAEEICNNIKNKHTKLSPADAVDHSDADLAAKFNLGRQPKKQYKGSHLEVGAKCRVLLKQRKNLRPHLTIKGQSRLYKSYHARHFAKGVHRIQKRIAANKKEVQHLPEPERQARTVYRYYVNGRWVDRDELLAVSGVDAETDKQVAARAR